jgi:cysteinyl-tRNA synthetase
MDEADVYVRQRGSDIEQNAIVGVFLRNLEYYNGILFMTSNLDSIDDAILSRATAHIVYSKPVPDDIETIYNIQSDLLNVKLSIEQLDILKSFEIVGRDIKALLKLAKFWLANKKQEELSMDEFMIVMSFIPATRNALARRTEIIVNNDSTR